MLGGKRISRDREADEASYESRRGYEEWTPTIEEVYGGLLAEGVAPVEVARRFREGEYDLTDVVQMWNARQATSLQPRERTKWGEWEVTGLGVKPLSVTT